MEQKESEDKKEEESVFQKIDPDNLKESISVLSPREKIQLAVECFGKNIYGEVIRIIITDAYENPEVFRQIGLMFKVMKKSGQLGKDEKCQSAMTYGFQAIISYHFEKLGLNKKGTTD